MRPGVTGRHGGRQNLLHPPNGEGHVVRHPARRCRERPRRGRLALGAARSARRRDACPRPPRLRPPRRAVAALIRRLVGRMARRRARLRRRAVGRQGRRRGRAVPRRLPPRALALARQRLRLRRDPRLLRGAPAGPGEGPVVGHHAGARPAPALHPARRRAARRRARDVLRLRRAPAVHGLEACPPRRRGDRPRAQPGAARAAPARPDVARLPRRPARRAGRRRADGHAAARGVRRRRNDRRRLRRRLGAGDLRGHAGAVRRLSGERVRDARPPRALFPAGGDDGPVRPPRPRPGRHPRLHRRQDAAHRRLAPAGLDLARRHRRRPRGDRGAVAPRWGRAGAADGGRTPWRRGPVPRTIRGMTRMSRDLGLQVRMLLTMFLLGLLYVALVAALLAAGTGTATMLLVVAGLALAQLTLSDRLALRAIGAREVSPADAPRLHAIVERLCAQADLPKPRIAIAPTAVPNAFALGRSPRRAVVCATTGLLDLLEPHELEAVMAHELAHVRHRDVLIMTVASFFASIAAMVLQFGVLFGDGRDRDNGQPAFVVVLLVSAVVYAVSFVLMLALSRYRELVADRGAAMVTGRPSALASALVKLSEGMDRVPQHDLRAAGELDAFFMVPARAQGALRTLCSTHPPVERRLPALARLEADLQRPVPARTCRRPRTAETSRAGRPSRTAGSS